MCKQAAAWPAAAFPTSADIVLTGLMGKDWGLVYRGLVRCSCTINSIGNRFLRSRHIGVEIRKNGSRSWSWGCAREGKKRSSFLSFFNFFITNVLLLCWPIDRSCYNLNKLETEVVSPQYLLHWHYKHLIPQNQIVDVSVPQSERKKPQHVLPNTDKRHWTCQVRVEIRLCSSLTPLTDPLWTPGL